MNDALIETQDLCKTYGSGAGMTAALRGVTLKIAAGSFTCIVGPSGHGKSTLMHLIGGLDRPSSGRVAIAGTDLAGLNNAALARLRAERIGFVFQFFNLLPQLTAQENIETALLFAGRAGHTTSARARDLLTRVGLAEKAGSRPHQLSGGQQQRVAIARALANDPELLLLDEPTGNLDSQAEAQVLSLLDGLHQDGRTIVLVTHNPAIAARAQRVIRVQDGRLAES